MAGNQSYNYLNQNSQNHPRSAEKIVAGILAGGQSRRLGRDKATIEWHQRSLIEWSFTRAQSITQNVYLLAKGQARYSHVHAPVLPDLYSTPTPLSGILTIGPFVKNWLLLLACDIVIFTDELLPYLWKQREPGKAVVVHSEEGLQPLLAYYPLEHMEYWEEAYRSGNYKLQPIVMQMPRVEVEAGELPRPLLGGPAFLNINHNADVARLRQLEAHMRVE